MSEVEPAWRAELRKDILAAAIAVNTAYRRGEVQPWTPMTDAVMSALEPHIQAAEQRGREEGLRQGRCQRCKGSGIDPEHSYPAEGPSYHSMGEPPHLEPCIDCQFPESP